MKESYFNTLNSPVDDGTVTSIDFDFSRSYTRF